MPLKTPGDEQPRDIDAGDEEYEGDRGKQRKEQLTSLFVQFLEQRPDRHRQTQQPGIHSTLSVRQRHNFRLGVRSRHTLSKAADRIPPARIRLRLVRRDRQPEIHASVHVVIGLARISRIGQEAHPGWHHPDHWQRCRVPADADGRPDDAGIAIESPLPEIVTKDDRGGRHLGAAGFRAGEVPPNHRRQPQYVEEVTAHDHPAKRLASIREHEKVEGPPIKRRGVDGPGTCTPVQPLANRAALQVGLPIETGGGKKNQPIGIGIRRRREQDALYKAEHRGRPADAQAKRHNRGRSKARTLPQLTSSIPNIFNHGGSCPGDDPACLGRDPSGAGCLLRAGVTPPDSPLRISACGTRTRPDC
jgi:hypothetical protein